MSFACLQFAIKARHQYQLNHMHMVVYYRTTMYKYYKLFTVLPEHTNMHLQFAIHIMILLLSVCQQLYQVLNN